MNTDNCHLVYGEQPADVFPGLQIVMDSMELGDDGMCHYAARFEPKVGNPLFRALMRAEAELLCEDAESIGSPEYVSRTSEQRASDALARLVFAVTRSPG